MSRVFTKLVSLMIFVLAAVLLASFVTAEDCWSYTDQTNCESGGCLWKSDGWGSWCEEANCWSLWTESECNLGNETINKYIVC